MGVRLSMQVSRSSRLNMLCLDIFLSQSDLHLQKFHFGLVGCWSTYLEILEKITIHPVSVTAFDVVFLDVVRLYCTAALRQAPSLLALRAPLLGHTGKESFKSWPVNKDSVDTGIFKLFTQWYQSPTLISTKGQIIPFNQEWAIIKLWSLPGTHPLTISGRWNVTCSIFTIFWNYFQAKKCKR